jgi:hypothetical protein
VVTVKANQKKLYQQLQSIAETTKAVDVNTDTEHTRNRQTTRTVSIFTLPDTVKAVWAGAQYGVAVTRVGERGGQPYSERHYYLTSLTADAARLQARIRAHWGIENP